MLRKIIRIDEEKCNGCGAVRRACHEGAIAMVNGKARLMREDYCDGLGDCLPACPTGAISFEEREAAAYDEAAVRASQGAPRPATPAPAPAPGVCSAARRSRRRAARSTCPASCPSGRCRSSWRPSTPPDFRGRGSADRRRLHRLCLRQLPRATSSAAASRWSAAPSWTRWTTRKS